MDFKFTKSKDLNLKNTKIFIREKIFFFTILLASLISLLGIMILVKSKGLSILDILSLEKLALIASTMSIERYKGELNAPKLYQISQAFLYAAISLSGLIYPYLSKKFVDKLLLFLPILISIFNGIINGARAGLFIGIFMFISGVIVGKFVKGEQLKLRKILIYVFVLIFIFFFFMIFIQILRGGELKFDISPLIPKIETYSIGSICAFTIWWHNYLDVHLYLGKYSFSGIYNLLFHNREIGLFSTPVFISNEHITNVYTIFRILIEDFSLAGSLLFIGFFGFISSYIYKLSMIKINLFSIWFFLVFYSIVFWSYVVILTTYNTFLLAFMLLFIFIKMNIKIIEEK